MTTVKGGCWINSVKYCDSACYIKDLPEDRLDFLGFRLVFTVDECTTYHCTKTEKGN